MGYAIFTIKILTTNINSLMVKDNFKMGKAILFYLENCQNLENLPLT